MRSISRVDFRVLPIHFSFFWAFNRQKLDQMRQSWLVMKENCQVQWREIQACLLCVSSTLVDTTNSYWQCYSILYPLSWHNASCEMAPAVNSIWIVRALFVKTDACRREYPSRSREFGLRPCLSSLKQCWLLSIFCLIPDRTLGSFWRKSSLERCWSFSSEDLVERIWLNEGHRMCFHQFYQENELLFL